MIIAIKFFSSEQIVLVVFKTKSILYHYFFFQMVFVVPKTKSIVHVFVQFSLRLLLWLMAFHVERQMVRSGKSPVTELAFKRFGARVFSKMSGKLIRASEPPFTAFPGAFIRFFTRMSSHVSLEMRTLGVNFITAWMFTVMYPTPL